MEDSIAVNFKIENILSPAAHHWSKTSAQTKTNFVSIDC